MTVVELSLAEIEAEQERRRLGRTIREEADGLAASLAGFVRAGWHVVWPNEPYMHGWHIDAICEHLEAVTAGDIRRLQIWVPPGSTKSTLVSICWPAWEWTREPRLRYLSGSYELKLATDLAVKSRDLIRSGWYQARWPNVILKRDQDLKQSYANTAGGERFVTSPGAGQSTGKHAHRILIDDALNAQEIVSEAKLNEVQEWHDGTLSTRFVDPRNATEVIIQQRLAERDLAGHVLDQHEWTILCLPEEYEPAHPYAWSKDPRTEAGELLWPDRVGDAEHASRLLVLGDYRAAGQLQQRPAAREGAILKRSGWRYFPRALLDDDNIANLPAFSRIIQSWDTAFKDKTTSDYVVGTVWGQHGADLYLLRLVRDRMSLSLTKAAMREVTGWIVERWPAAGSWILIEKSANGVEIIEELRRELQGVVAIAASTSKVARAEAAEPALEAGNIHLPGAAAPDEPSGYSAALTPAWAQGLVEECAVFPNGEHDDQVDSFTQAVNWARSASTGPTRLARPASQGRLEPGHLQRIEGGSLSGGRR
jgi:predicted phage terminase large subunit-like protein